MSIDQDDTVVVIGDTLVITDDRGHRIILVGSPGQPVGVATSGGGTHIPVADVARVVEFLGGHIVTEDEVLARIAQTEYYDLLVEKSRQIHDVLERAVQERDGAEVTAGSPLWDARVLLGLDGRTGARDIRTEANHG